jgi:uncharacterized membrane protein YoaT (DUF817 family)
MPLHQLLPAFDAHLTEIPENARLRGVSRYVVEFLYFGIKEARACLFAGVFFFAIFTVPRGGILHIPRYDVLLLIALVIQIWMVVTKLESVDELKAVCFFHLIGFALEVFKTSSSIHSWAYPDFAYSKLFGVPLFSGFMYAAIGSYIIQAWRLLALRVRHHPPYRMAAAVSVIIYVNFFTHHYIGDYRWYIAASIVGLYSRSTVIFRPYDRDRRMPLLVSFALIGFFIWLFENISTFFGIWRYPSQLGAWSIVSIGIWSSWCLVVIMTFTIVAYLKHIRGDIHIPE